jgi:hypothetical protein
MRRITVEPIIPEAVKSALACGSRSAGTTSGIIASLAGTKKLATANKRNTPP